MSMTSANVSPAVSATATTSSRRRTPHAESRSRSDRSKARLLGAVGRFGTDESAVVVEGGSGCEHATGAAHESFCRRPRRDVQHVDADDRVGGSHRPVCPGDVEFDRVQDVVGVSVSHPRADARERFGGSIRRLPQRVGKPWGEVHGVLAGPAGDLEDPAGGWQHSFEYRQDVVTIAFRRGGVVLHGFGARSEGYFAPTTLVPAERPTRTRSLGTSASSVSPASRRSSTP